MVGVRVKSVECCRSAPGLAVRDLGPPLTACDARGRRRAVEPSILPVRNSIFLGSQVQTMIASWVALPCDADVAESSTIRNTRVFERCAATQPRWRAPATGTRSEARSRHTSHPAKQRSAPHDRYTTRTTAHNRQQHRKPILQAEPTEEHHHGIVSRTRGTILLRPRCSAA